MCGRDELKGSRALCGSMEVSIVIPFYNEQENVAVLLGEVRGVCAGLGRTYEAVLVNDGSTDDTGMCLDEEAKKWPQARIFHFAENHGQAAALYFGLQRATGDILVTLDGDGQNDPADIPRLLATLKDCDMAAGIRARRKDSALRLAMSRLANGVRSKILGDGVRDTGCSLKAFRREVVASFIPIRTMYSFMAAMAVNGGFRIQQIEVAHRPRTRGVSKYGLMAFLWRPLVDMVGLVWLFRRRIPCRIALRTATETPKP